MLSSDKVVIVGDFNIYMDVDSDSLKLAFNSLLELMGVSQKVKEPTYCFNLILDLVLTYGLEPDHLLLSPLNPLLLDHDVIIIIIITIIIQIQHS